MAPRRDALGDPSDVLLTGRLDGVRCVFLPATAAAIRIPSELNYRANIDALKRLDVTDVISLSAVGSLREELPPGHFVVIDQFIDRSFARKKTFFEEGSSPMSRWRIRSARASAMRSRPRAAPPWPAGDAWRHLSRHGGPPILDAGRSELYRSWGCSVIGMTNMPEAKLAREAELCYATVAMVTDFDCWHPEHEDVTVEVVVRVLLSNAEDARALVRDVVPAIAAPRGPCPAGCDRALDHAIITAPDKRAPASLARLDAVARRILRAD